MGGRDLFLIDLRLFMARSFLGAEVTLQSFQMTFGEEHMTEGTVKTEVT